MADSFTIRRRALPEIRRVALLSSLLILLLAGSALYVITDPVMASRFAMSRTAITLHERYAGIDVDWAQMISQGYAALFEPLDRYSGPVREAQFRRMDEEENGQYSGIGVSVIADSGSLLIVGIREGGPAAGAGLESGDRIIRVDSTMLTAATVDRSIDLLRGTEGTNVAIAVVPRNGGDTLTKTLTRKKLPLVHVPYAGLAADGIGYVRLTDFDPGAAAEVAEKVAAVKTEANGKLRGFILDLRSNPGGLLDEAVSLADEFLPADSLIVGTSARSRWRSQEWHARDGDLLDGIPMIVLVDHNTASAAEIVSGALKENGRARLLGDTTFGKGLVQGFRRFPDGSGVKLTQARYYLPGRVYLNDFDSTLTEIGRGLVPNILASNFRTDLFTQWLEVSGSLERFATLHADQLMASTHGGFLPGNDWLNQFSSWLDSAGTHYESVSTRQLRILTRLSEITGSPGANAADLATVHRKLQEMLDLSAADDHRLAAGHDAYITYRLAQLAWERRGGTDGAYREVIVAHHPVIRQAVELLAGPPAGS